MYLYLYLFLYFCLYLYLYLYLSSYLYLYLYLFSICIYICIYIYIGICICICICICWSKPLCVGIKSWTIIETGAREPLAGLGKHLDCALMNLFDKSSAVHRYSVRPSSPPKRLQPILFTLIIHPQQKKAIRQNSNLHSPLLRTNKFRVCAQISGQAARGQIQSLGPLEKKCANHAKRILQSQTSQQA